MKSALFNQTAGIKKATATALLLGAVVLPASTFADPATSQFKKDREAILAMAGKHKVTFRFHETYSLDTNYKIRNKAYKESAHELVKVVEDSGKRIVLQHILQVDDGLEVMVVKHWGQIWTFEDTEILEYQHGTTWKKRHLKPAAVKGTWSQYVTQTDESPRYESYGTWKHQGTTSTWSSQETARPLPRREYSKRSDYDVLMGHNVHTVTPNGWIHEQANRKLVKRDGKYQFLCAERGFNSYDRESDHDFSEAETYWKTNAPFWKNVRSSWWQTIQKSTDLSYQRKVNNVTLSRAVGKLRPKKKDAKLPTVADITKTITPYVVQTAQQK